MTFIDTHTHLYLPQFDSDIDEIIQRSLQRNVTKLVLPNIDSQSIEPLKNLYLKSPEVFVPLMGLHPTHVKENVNEELEEVIKELGNNKYYGIGEIGIDLYWDKTFAQQQAYAFKKQLSLGHEKDLPVVIHARNSLKEIFQVLEELNYNSFKGIFHAFTGNISDAKRMIEMGFYLGIGGIVTFKNSMLDETLADIDLNHIVLETDSPYLAPSPHRGKRNESSYIPLIAGKVAEIKGISIEKVAEVTTGNALNIFNL
jgi:TatD DNase family protein